MASTCARQGPRQPDVGWIMAVRKSLRPTERFEVFKRDGFSCVYCGSRPPQVILEVDHIVAVANGGSNEESNLVTACRQCNQGKSDKRLTITPKPLAQQQEDARECAAQLDEYNKFLMGRRALVDEMVDEIGRYWCNIGLSPDSKDYDVYSFGPQRANSVRTFLKHLTFAEIIEAVDIAHSRDIYGRGSSEQRFRYFCGICWKIIKQRRGEDG